MILSFKESLGKVLDGAQMTVSVVLVRMAVVSHLLIAAC